MLLAAICQSAPTDSPIPAPPRKQGLWIAFDPALVPASGPTDCTVSVGPMAPVAAVAFSPDGKTLAAARHQDIVLWDLDAVKLARVLPANSAGGIVTALAFSKDGRRIVAAVGLPRQSGLLRVFDAQTGGEVTTISGPRDLVNCLAVSADGQLLAAASADKMVYVWDVSGKDPKPVTTLKDCTEEANAVAWSPDGAMLAAGSADRNVRIWLVEDWSLLETTAYPEPVHAVAFSPDGKFVAAGLGWRENKSVRTRTAPEKPVKPTTQSATQPARRPPAPQTRIIETGGGIPQWLVWTADGRIFAACSDGLINNLSASQTAPLPPMTGHRDWVYCLSASGDGKLASGGADGTVRLWRPVPTVAPPGVPAPIPAGQLLVTLVQLAPGGTDWAAISSRGWFDTSTPAAIRWRSAATSQPDKMMERFRDARQVKLVLDPKPVPPPAPPTKTPPPAPKKPATTRSTK